MALQELTKQEIRSLLAGATAANAIVSRIEKDDPDEITRDEIRQWEIKAFYALDMAKEVIALAFKRRLEAGASVQAGVYRLEPDSETLEDLQANMLEYQGGGFNTTGFDNVALVDPAKSKQSTGATRQSGKKSAGSKPADRRVRR